MGRYWVARVPFLVKVTAHGRSAGHPIGTCVFRPRFLVIFRPFWSIVHGSWAITTCAPASQACYSAMSIFGPASPSFTWWNRRVLSFPVRWCNNCSLLMKFASLLPRYRPLHLPSPYFSTLRPLRESLDVLFHWWLVVLQASEEL